MEASMMGEKRGAPGRLFYEFDPELMIRMLLVGYCCGIRSKNDRASRREAGRKAKAPDWRHGLWDHGNAGLDG